VGGIRRLEQGAAVVLRRILRHLRCCGAYLRKSNSRNPTSLPSASATKTMGALGGFSKYFRVSASWSESDPGPRASRRRTQSARSVSTISRIFTRCSSGRSAHSQSRASVNLAHPRNIVQHRSGCSKGFAKGGASDCLGWPPSLTDSTVSGRRSSRTIDSSGNRAAASAHSTADPNP